MRILSKRGVVLDNYESRYIELKAAKGGVPKSIWETYSSFANTDGGIIFLGIDDNGVVVGVQDPVSMKQDIINTVNNDQKISYNVLQSDNDIEIIVKDNKSILKITVREAPYSKKPVYLNNNISNSYLRHGEGDYKAKINELKTLIASSKDSIDNELLSGFTLDDLNRSSVIKYANIVDEHDITASSQDIKNFLIRIGAYKKNRNTNEYMLTTGGLLFFGEYNSIIDKFPSFQLDYFEKNSSFETRWNDRVSTGDMSYPELNIFEFLLIVLDKLENTLKEEFILDDENFKRLPIKKDLQEMLREALVNSLMHAYYDNDFPIKITAYPDYYEFENPGKMRISKKEFIHGGRSIARNSTLALFLRRAGFAERAGSGGPKIFDTAQKYKLKTPELTTDFDTTLIRIWKVDVTKNFENLEINEQAIMYYVFDNGEITRSVASTELNLSPSEFRTATQSLIKNNLLFKVGRSTATKYVLPPSSEEQAFSIKRLLKEIEDSYLK